MKRLIRTEGDLSYVPLTKGYEAVIDTVDIPLVEGWNWAALVSYGRSTYAFHTSNRPVRKSIYLHRVIMGEPDGMEVDHINGNGLDNRRSNLRLATSSQNKHNTGPRKNSTSGFKGVTWDKANSKWQAQITLHGKVKKLGRFPTPEEAYEAYCKASGELHGEFGRTK